MTIEELVAEIDKLSVLDLNELVKAIEEKYGVSAAAGVVVAAAGPAAAAGRHGLPAGHGSLERRLSAAQSRRLGGPVL